MSEYKDTENLNYDDSPKKNKSIDLSKVKNLAAIEKAEDRSFVKTIHKSKGSVNTSIIPFETTRVQLPSKGIPYKNITQDPDILDGFIVIREMRGHDEKILATQQYLKDGTAIKRILKNCITSDIDIEDMVAFDINYILFALRGLSYGDDYSFKSKCNNSMCEREMNLECKISELSFNELPEDFEEPITVKLPRSKFTIECVLSRQSHVDELRRLERTDVKKSEFDYDKSLMRLYILTTLRIEDPEGQELPKRLWEDFYDQLSAADLAELRDKTDYKTDVEAKEVICPYCGTTQRIQIPMGADFFRMR